MRRFVEREVLPVVAERERGDDYPGDLLPALAALGVLGMSIPEEHGGSAVDLVGYALVFEELARGWMGLASVVGSSQSGCWLLGRFGTDDQRQRFLPDLAAGRRMSGIALTEPATGSDLKAITLRAERRGGAYVVNGTKTMITQARHADPLVVLAVTDPTVTPTHRGMSLLLVEQGTPGWTVGRDITKLGHKGVELCELAFDDAVVPAANLLGGTEGSGLSQMLAALDRGRIYMAAASVGIARAALEAATRYATEREAFGSVIGEHQAIKLKLAGMAIRVRAARLLTHAAAARIDREGRARSDAAMAKVFASETAIECSLEAMRVLGGYGYTTDFPVERLYRDAPLMAIGEGTNEILQLLIADELLAAARAADEGRRHGGRRRAGPTGVLDVDGQPHRRTGRCCIRGYDLEELIGGQSFTASTFLLLRGRLPTPQRGERALDAVLDAVLDYALREAGHGRRPLHRLGQPEHGGRPGRRRPGRRPAHARPRGHGPVHPRRARPDGGGRDDGRGAGRDPGGRGASRGASASPASAIPASAASIRAPNDCARSPRPAGCGATGPASTSRSTGPSRPCPARPTSPSTTWA